jgi:hypothetical protein
LVTADAVGYDRGADRASSDADVSSIPLSFRHEPVQGRAEAEPDLVVTEHGIAELRTRPRADKRASGWRDASGQVSSTTFPA